MRLGIGILTVFVAISVFAAQGQRVSGKSRTPFNMTITDDCTGEDIQASGTVHSQYNARETADGWRAESMTNYQGVNAVGVTSGRKYRVVGSDKTVVDFRRPYPARNNVVQTVRLISQGKAPNAHYKMHWRYTIDGNGQLRSEIDRVEVQCR